MTDRVKYRYYCIITTILSIEKKGHRGVEVRSKRKVRSIGNGGQCYDIVVI